MDRRQVSRWARRILVRFWRTGEERPYVGHTLNLSAGGMFVSTDRPASSGTRVRVEVLDQDQGFMVEGVVTHSRRVAPELRRVHEPGMGVRFLSHEELVAPLLPQVTEQTGATRPAGTATAKGATGEAFAVRFSSPHHFIEVFERDIQHGGLFVATRSPAALNQVISLQLILPLDGVDTVEVPARVVHRYDPAEHGAGDRPDRPPGMGVEFVDRELTVSRLRHLARRLSE
jgi:Tfp pilus assembly protein PilZ